MNSFAFLITVCCWTWIISFLISDAVIFHNLATFIFDDKKGGLPFVGIGIPILLAASSILLLGRQSEPDGTTLRKVVALPHHIPARIQVLAHFTLKWFQAPKLDPNFNVLAFSFVFLPSFKYLASCLQRHWWEIDPADPDAYKETVEETANAFGMVGVIIMSVFLLIPITKHSALLNMMGWDAVNAVRLHVWAGRLLIIVVTIHGCLYMYQWRVLQHESIIRLIVPPTPCWTLQESDFQPTCRNADCTCYQIFRNLTGFLGFLALVTIGLTSRNSIRRKYFGFFYKVHMISTPLAFLMVIFHYKRGMPYLAGGIVYYLASSVPVWVEKYANQMQGGTRVLSVERIGSSDDFSRICTVVTIDASDSALSRYRAGQYVRLTAPWISRVISHPFTINPVPGQPNQFCIIFRSTGKFTTQLSYSLFNGSQSTSDKRSNMQGQHTRQLSLIIDGFYGSSSRTSQVLQHDVVVFVAGGVGITPFLSLLHRVHQSLHSGQGSNITKKVILHWVCREEELVHYVKHHFFNPLLMHGESVGFTMTLVIHLTGTTATTDDPECYTDKNGILMTSGQPLSSHGGLQEAGCADIVERHAHRISGVPFSPSKFAPMSKRFYRNNLLSFTSLATSSVTGLCIIWYCYKHVQGDDTMSTRIVSLLLVILMTFIVGIAANLAKRHIHWLDPEEDFIAVPVTCTITDKSDDESFEMIEKLGSTTTIEELGNRTSTQTSSYNAVNIEVRKGRPDFECLFRCLNQGTRPGIFVCGPESIMENVRQAIGRRTCCLNPPRCGRDRISLYEESFVL